MNNEKYNLNNVSLNTYVSDVFDMVPDNLEIDVITFNPPAVSLKISEDDNIIRNTSVGAYILEKFFYQIKTKNILNNNGEIYIVLSNTAELHKIISYSLVNSFFPQIYKKISFPEPYDKISVFLFQFKYINNV